jgi:glycosyltransferase involved in cell wall biosynthesis
MNEKITFINSSMGMGGVPRVINLWANYFINKGYVIEITSNIDIPLFYDFDTRIKYSVLGIDRFNQSSKVRALFKIYFFLKGRKDETLIFNKALYINYLFLLKKVGLIDKSLKLIYFVHGGSSNFITMYDDKVNCKINYIFDEIIALHNDFSFQEEGSKRKFSNSLISSQWSQIKDKINYIPNPVTFRSEDIADYNAKMVLAVGRLDPIKGFDLLIKSWSRVIKKYPDWKLKIVGSGEEKENLEKLVSSLSLQNYVFLIPQQEDIKSQYLTSSIYVMSSRKEGFGMVTIEAMECGLPVVAFSNVGSKFLVKNHINGLLCEVGDIDELSENIMKLVVNKDLRIKMSQKSIELVKVFYIENIAEKWNRILRVNFE